MSAQVIQISELLAAIRALESPLLAVGLFMGFQKISSAKRLAAIGELASEGLVG